MSSSLIRDLPLIKIDNKDKIGLNKSKDGGTILNADVPCEVCTCGKKG